MQVAILIEQCTNILKEAVHCACMFLPLYKVYKRLCAKSHKRIEYLAEGIFKILQSMQMWYVFKSKIKIYIKIIEMIDWIKNAFSVAVYITIPELTEEFHVIIQSILNGWVLIVLLGFKGQERQKYVYIKYN